MNKLKLCAIGLVLAGGLSAQSVQCDGITKSNNQCKNKTIDTTGLCYLHNPNYVKVVSDTTTAVVCGGITKSNNPCKNKTKDSSGLCHHHRD